MTNSLLTSETETNEKQSESRAHNPEINRNKKRRALRGKPRVVVLINSVAFTNIFFTSLIPSPLCVMPG